MIPPCDPVILENNPQFRKLYQHLTTNLLNADGSTRANDEQPVRKAVLEELRSCRVRSATKQIKQQTLQELAFDADSGLPDDHRDPLAVITLYLESSPSRLELEHGDDRGHAHAHPLSLLASDIDAFYSIIPALVIPFSNALSSALQDLRAIANAGNSPDCAPSAPAILHTSAVTTRARVRTSRNPSKAKPQAPLASQLRERLQNLRQIQLSQIPAARARMAITAAKVLATRAEILKQTVVLLERVKHGALSRATKAKAEHLALVAQGVEAKLSIMKLDTAATIYTPEVVTALDRYRQHLRETRERLEEKQGNVLEELKAYEGVDSAEAHGPFASNDKQHFQSCPMREIARRAHKKTRSPNMADEALSIYDEIEIEDMTFDPNLQIYHYPCPCGDRFEIAIDDLRDGEDIAVCPSCSLMIRVIFDVSDLPKDGNQPAPGAVSVQA
ncbi:uncharacterized protein CDV56_103197 [Aspergillus thermomutatus]|uniref:Diphthamide biosynthesis protein 3 n=1 Tax=Aspergillus thermomutatus TaxID=41047 RepID=A0A397GGF0_ASPTH|nr:uncharacterized protein CDV56_103197 [Aspergillus thermomutatus]RHZ50065.1 hypothetical protein CDV56_103197 [Aspergillus thermomutatus]